MSLFGSLMRGFDDDSIFGGHRSIMRQMDQMMASMIRDPFEEDPFFGSGGGGGGGAFPALTAGPAPATNAVVAARSQRPRARDPFSALGLPSMANMMSSIIPLPLTTYPTPLGTLQNATPCLAEDQMAQQGNCHMYSSSSVMTMTTGPDGRPQVYQATSSTRGVPGGVRETRRTINDSRTGTRKMAIGHHIGERSHIIEREHTARNMEERQEFINLEEEEAPQFDEEFRRRTQQAMGVGSLEYRPRHRPSSSYNPRVSSVPAITSSSRYRNRSRPMLSITAGPSEDRARRRDREERGHRSHRRNEPNM